jgi:hypothetical protein
LWQQATERVQALRDAGDTVLVVWDGSVWEKPESQANADWCAVRSSKARRLARRRTGFSLPPSGPPILVPGLHCDGLVVLGHDGPPTLAHLEWWTTPGEHATTHREVVARLGKGREPWYLLTADPIRTAEDAWTVVLAYVRRWQIEFCVR